MPALPPVTSVSLQTVLVATDFSACSNLALRFAHAIARQQHGTLLLAHVLGSDAAYPNLKLSAAELLAEELAARTRMQRLLERMNLNDVPHQLLTARGELCPGLEEMIEQHAVELVVVATRGRDGLGKLLLGSGAEQVFRRALCPVLTVGPHVSSDLLEQGCFKRVLCAIDFSPASLHGVHFGEALAQQSLTLMHAICKGVASAEFGSTLYNPQEIADARSMLSSLCPPRPSTDIVVELGDPAQCILRAAREQNASLIIMGARPQSEFASTHLPWATAHRVVCDADCPVLTIR